ncbi:hypothetical protein [Roseibium marinum]|uniref:YARHG domain-containing protein n=1 Tax=Roseibium marinum TaxID=281252 RepID=A0A2S3UVB6_9HYPH|nr:hypothetical protein [Roseibium marinum]POF31510.1 hypothetical protein CLV41_10472 [Roseibium marinum]
MKQILRRYRREVLRHVYALLAAALTVFPVAAQSFSTNPANFPGMTCQQLWYIEQEVLAEGRVCLQSERARRAFRRAKRCISSDETILPKKTRDYLEQLRSAARNKGCAGF